MDMPAVALQMKTTLGASTQASCDRQHIGRPLENKQTSHPQSAHLPSSRSATEMLADGSARSPGSRRRLSASSPDLVSAEESGASTLFAHPP
jgi:hypothetical protein